MTSNGPSIWAALERERALAALAQRDPSPSLLTLFGLGTLELEARRAQMPESMRARKEPTRALLMQLSLDFLESAASETREAALDAWEADAVGEALERALRGLRVRDHVERVLIGAEVILGEPARLDPDAAMFLAEFEALVRPELWRLVGANEVRAREAEALAPNWRPRFWWWSYGVDVPSSAAAMLPAVGRFVAVFPEARAELVRAERRFTDERERGVRSAMATAERSFAPNDVLAKNDSAHWLAAGRNVEAWDENATSGSDFLVPNRLALLVGTRESLAQNPRLQAHCFEANRPEPDADER